MNSKIIEQENLCLRTKLVIDQLRTNLFMLEDFKDFKKYDKDLKDLKSIINKIYWDL